jgi:beta-glucosidase
VFDTIVSSAPAGKATVAIGDAAVDVTAAFKRIAGKGKQTVRIPLSCFSAKGADLSKVQVPFAVASDGALSAAFANIQVVGGGAREKDIVACGEAS